MGGNFLCTKKQPGGRAFDCPQINIMKGKYQMEKFEYPVRTDEEGFYNVTRQVRDAVGKSGVQDGVFTAPTLPRGSRSMKTRIPM